MDKINEIWPAWHTVELIGRGGFGEVYKAKRERLGEEFCSAVKIIRIPKEDSEVKEMIAEGHTSQSVRYYYESVVRGLMNEIKVLDALKSVGNVVNIEEFEILEREDSIGWDAYIRMELLQNLNAYRQNHQLDQQEVAKLGMDLCEALVCCEKSHIIHRDIKPSNIFVDKYGTFKLGDFGIARQMEKTQSTLSRKGTDLYMAPEVRYGKSGSSYNVDIYSLGLVMYRLLNNNRMPFEPLDKEMMSYQEREEALVRRLEGEEIPLPVNSDVRLGEIIRKACEYDKAKRYQSAEEMKKDLEAWTRNEPLMNEKNKKDKPASESAYPLPVLLETEEEKTVAAFETITFSDREKVKQVEEKKEPVREEEPERTIQETKGNNAALIQKEENSPEKEEKSSKQSYEITGEEQKQLGKKANRAYLALMAYGVFPLYYIFSTYIFSYAFFFLGIQDPIALSIIGLAASGILLGGIRILFKKGWCKLGLVFTLTGGYLVTDIALSFMLFVCFRHFYIYLNVWKLSFLVLPVIYKLSRNLAKGSKQIETVQKDNRNLTLCVVIALFEIYDWTAVIVRGYSDREVVQILKGVVLLTVLCVLMFLGKHLVQKRKTGIILCTAGGAIAGYSIMTNWVGTFFSSYLFELSYQYSMSWDSFEISWAYRDGIWSVLVGGIGAVIVAVLCYKWSKAVWKSQEIGANGQD